jgi:hypothetical protein
VGRRRRGATWRSRDSSQVLDDMRIDVDLDVGVRIDVGVIGDGDGDVEP